MNTGNRNRLVLYSSFVKLLDFKTNDVNLKFSTCLINIILCLQFSIIFLYITYNSLSVGRYDKSAFLKL